MKIKNLSVKYEDTIIIDNFSLEIQEGENVCILGKSGCGKTTLLKAVAGLLKPEMVSGEISMEGLKNISYVFQETRLLPWHTVYDNLYIVSKDIKKIDFILANLELLEYKDKYPNQLSGGMAQRVNIARALAYKCDIILMDEPFKGLNYNLKNKVLNFVKEFTEENGIDILFVEHDLEMAKFLADRIIISDGLPLRITKEVKVEELEDNNSSLYIYNNYL